MTLPVPVRQTLARRVIVLRDTRQWSQKRLAQEIGISVSTLNAIERAKILDIKLTTFVLLYECFEVSPAFLLGVEAQEGQAKPRLCPSCGAQVDVEHYSTGALMVYLTEHGKSVSFLMSAFLMTRHAVEVLLGDEYARLQRKRQG